MFNYCAVKLSFFVFLTIASLEELQANKVEEKRCEQSTGRAIGADTDGPSFEVGGIGGPKPSKKVTAPWHVVLDIKLKSPEKNPLYVYEQTRRCTGLLVHERAVLTLGECLRDSKQTGWTLYIGAEGEETFTSSAQRLAGIHVTHEIYASSANPAYNFGLVILDDPMKFNSTVDKGVLVTSMRTPDDKWRDCVVSTSGLEVINGRCEMQTKKKYYDGQLLEHACCKPFLPPLNNGHSYPSNVLCFRNMNAMSCLGDEGSPVSCIDFANKRVVVGLLDLGRQCCNAQKEQINTPQETALVRISPEITGWVNTKLLVFNLIFPNQEVVLGR